MGADLGIEYIVTEAADENDLYGYKWKIGVSVMDIGYNSFRYGSRSRQAIAGKDNILDTVIENRFDNVSGTDALVDSLTSIAGAIQPLSGNFHVIQPTRLVINADRHVVNNFYINAELTIPLAFSSKNTFLVAKDMNLLALTPRLENKKYGLYLPITFNVQNQLWVGGAFKAGPVLMGLHNWANLFGKNKMHRGGLYIAVTIRPGEKKERSGERGRSLPARTRRQLGCPVF
jgi:Family of unknown function (DUF5723)